MGGVDLDEQYLGDVGIAGFLFRVLRLGHGGGCVDLDFSLVDFLKLEFNFSKSAGPSWGFCLAGGVDGGVCVVSARP